MNDIVYISDGCHVDDLHQLRNEPVIRDFANVTPDTYDLIAATNPVLKMMIDLAKRICTEERGLR